MFIAAIWVIGLPLGYLTSESIWPDEAFYAWHARQIAADPGHLASPELYEYHPPLFPLLLTPGVLAANDLSGFRFIVILLNLTGLIMIYQLGCKIRSRFLGTFCWIALAFNYVFLSQAGRILIDGPLSVFMMAFMLAWFSWHDSGQIRHLIYALILASAILFMKSSGVILIPVIICLSWLKKTDEQSPLIKRSRLWLPAMTISVWFLTLLLRYAITGTFFFDLSALPGYYRIGPWWECVLNLKSMLMLNALLPIFMLGLLLGLFMGDERMRAACIWFIVVFVTLSVVREKNLRYDMLFFPPALLITGAALETICNKIFQNDILNRIAKIVILVLVLIIFIGDFPVTQRYINNRYATFIGFSQAGKWVNDNIRKQTLFICESLRVMRYYMVRNIKQPPGEFIVLPDSQAEFESLLASETGPCMLELDFWGNIEKFQWLLRLKPSILAYLKQHGFELSHVVSGPVRYRGGRIIEQPLVWLFSRPGESKETLP